ncbi:MAG TPA: DUF541 domain-containing protein [Firmicutes bacterium]|nr:DUF541 domain-containing protein [Bacillota bacterium]
MKKIIVFVLAAFFAVSCTASQEQRSIVSVTGKSEIRVVPDEVVISVTVQTDDKNLQEAKRKNDRLASNLISAVNKLGVEKKDIQTGYIQIEPRYEKRYEQEGFAGYFVKNTVTIKIRDINKFEVILSEAVTNNIDRVNGIVFGTSKKEELEKKARLDAVKDAKIKAVDMASEIGQSAGRAVSIRENRVFYQSADYRPAGVMRMAETAGSASAFEPGEIIISAEIHAEFILK